jgi:tetratricopeptide (TPR) repeat protein
MEAEQAARQSLALDPGDPISHAVLALCLDGREKYKEATEEARQAVSLAPDFSYCHYVMARVLLSRNHLEQALAAINEALRLDADDADFHALQAAILGAKEKWTATLEAAERGLAQDSEHVECINMRAMALAHLGRKEEAHATTQTALARDPENAITHANHGWTLLRQGQTKQSLEHFREALRIEPGLEWAQHGIIEALKSRNFVYRIMLRYFFWMSTLSSKARWAVVIGIYVLSRIMRSAAKVNPAWQPLLLPLIVVLVVFVMMTWIAQPLFNLFLRVSKFGRLALSREQIVASNLVGACLGGVLAGVIGQLLVGGLGWLTCALACWFLIIPISGLFSCSPGWPRQVMVAYAVLLAACGASAVLINATAGPGDDFPPQGWKAIGFYLFVATLIGGVLAPWVANGLAMVRPRR